MERRWNWAAKWILHSCTKEQSVDPLDLIKWLSVKHRQVLILLHTLKAFQKGFASIVGCHWDCAAAITLISMGLHGYVSGTRKLQNGKPTFCPKSPFKKVAILNLAYTKSSLPPTNQWLFKETKSPDQPCPTHSSEREKTKHMEQIQLVWLCN